MSRSGYLVDTSAIVRLSRDPTLRAKWLEPLDAGLLAICPITELEVLHGATSLAHWQSLELAMDETYRWVVMPDRIATRAKDVERGLAVRGMHQSAGAVDLLVAATAEEHRLTLLHYDRDFDCVAEVTGQPVCWLADSGSID
ncbi:PIN domain nuclease [Actinoplanes sp. NPDC051513]|uniref:PIN domain nuclease n=1 Tax=Actinoplanes sp. NPDC051513 TaxID=3363908 RepID=UPI0037B4C377